MADITDLAVYLSTGRCIAWIGAGPSVEVGLPQWKDLANYALEECRRSQRAGFASIEQLYRQDKYPEMFDRVEQYYGRAFLSAVCVKALEDTGRNGTIYTALASLNFLSYFTTNYDSVMERHLEGSGHAVQRYTNSDEDIRRIDIDTTPALVKLHGDVQQPDSMLITKSDYQQWYQSGQKESFQTLVKTHLARDRIIFVGYSLSDPDMMAIQERLAVNLRRAVPSIALLPNFSRDDIDSWRTYYNVDVLSYRSVGNNHSELHAILSSVSRVLALGETAPRRQTTEELKKIQALYLWHRFSPNRSGEAPVDALQSVILRLTLDAGGAIEPPDVVEQLETRMGFAGEDSRTDVELAMQRLVEAGWLNNKGSEFFIPEEARIAVETYESRFSDMMEVFRRQALMDLNPQGKITETSSAQLVQAVLDTLMDVFEVRGRENTRYGL